MPEGTSLAGAQYFPVECLIVATTTEQACPFRQREQHGVGVLIGKPDSSRLLEPPRSQYFYQLARDESGPTCSTNLPFSTTHLNTRTHGQHHVPILHQQAGWMKSFSPHVSSNQDMALMLTPRTTTNSTTHCREREHHSRLRIQANIHEAPMETLPLGLLMDSIPLGTSFSRLVRRPDHSPPARIRVMDARSKARRHRHILRPLVQLAKLLPKPTVEPTEQVPTQNMAGRLDRNHHSTNLAERTLVPDATRNEHCPTNTSISNGYCPGLPQDTLTLEEPTVEARRIQSLKRRYEDRGLTDDSMNIFMGGSGEQTNQPSVSKGTTPLHYMGIAAGCLPDRILSARPHQLSRYSFGTITSHRTAVLKLHDHPNSIRHHEDITNLFTRLAQLVPPIRKTKPKVDLTLTLQFLSHVASSTDTPLASLSKKTAFPLVMAAFLQPSGNKTILSRKSIYNFILVTHVSTPVLSVVGFGSLVGLLSSFGTWNACDNWSNEDVFQHHYRRNHVLSADFTSLVIRLTNTEDNSVGDKDGEQFFDAPDTVPL
ncbi:hypothetical protein PHYBLDRAFT_64261 [Phycomyces blakesleeanus NRRL 1555(-)]|uniref:Uncharacterized protein n=1 Tax=Phycomyces blakesleeanus (strain ATCC 8743b / DSM 1359 / FGSC 10004 / NBRC 33097 / NRRL 1555) TaxID=763407 RepID=A0A162XJM8_PHYB8|nr:hypothetical protein PHYBLDRAFT_64261 [Phycomyces blakesleeanus NRRL 1555(-)]OAD75335.1 hypothetical protein PHYBLDRAFT_64261 [Phycomyces blakesleeanus NRRL 1555(-)]|eukprot:XP_018293375.1 hypothetical protein PHYBLDRAFT_64261 [Phycomyces blakesleeanus NRRL 1555(-)]